MISGLADDIAKAAAAREENRAATAKRRRKKNDKPDDFTGDDSSHQSPPSQQQSQQSQQSAFVQEPPLTPKSEQPPQKPQRIPTLQPKPVPKPRGLEDPPGWNSGTPWKPNSMEYMQYRIRKAHQQQQQQRHESLDHHQVVDDNDSFHLPISSWVPIVDKQQREDDKTNGAATTNWYQSHETRVTLDKAMPSKSWEAKLDDPFHKMSQKNSWAPHLHPGGPNALQPYPPGNATASGRTTTSSSSSSSRSETIDVVSSSGEEESETIEVVDDSDTNSNSTSNSHTTTSSSGESESTNRAFARAMAMDGKLRKLSSGFSHATNSSSSGATGTSPQTSKSSSTTDVEGGQHQDGDGHPDYTTYLVDSNDTFQVFDENWGFNPSRGTLCVLLLCIVLALEGVAVGLYFALR